MSIQNFPKIPNIVLRKPCDEPKHAKTPTLVWVPNIRIFHSKCCLETLRLVDPLYSTGIGLKKSTNPGYEGTYWGTGWWGGGGVSGDL